MANNKLDRLANELYPDFTFRGIDNSRESHREIFKTGYNKAIEDRFGPINHIQSVLSSIISNAETMTSGNVAHHRASIKLLAEGLLNYTKEMEG